MPLSGGISPGRLFSFGLRIINNGVIQHAIHAPGDLTTAIAAPEAGWLISGATATLATSPTGTDSSTAFASGAKIGSTLTHGLIFDTPSMDATLLTGLWANIIANPSLGALVALPGLQSQNVNGVTRTRLIVAFRKATDAAALTIDTTNIGAGLQLRCIIGGFYRG